jgi:hypothetical protein
MIKEEKGHENSIAGNFESCDDEYINSSHQHSMTWQSDGLKERIARWT